MRLTGPPVDRISLKYTNQSAQANGIFSLSGIEKPQISSICSRKHFDVGPVPPQRLITRKNIAKITA
jgi:hypothetical protein